MGTTVNKKAEVLERLLGASQALTAMGVASVGLFGSFVRDEVSPRSDVDLLVDFLPGKHCFDNFMDVAFFLEELLGRKVEVVTPEALSPHIGPHILREVERVLVAA